jgi:hypothetical protein
MAASLALALRGCGFGRFWLSAFCVALMPTSIGYQDIAAMMARQPAVPAPRAHMIASPFGTIEPVTFRYGIQPIGTAMPQPPAIMLVNFDPRSVYADAWSIGEPLSEATVPQIDYPTVNREHKADRLPVASAVPAAAPAQGVLEQQPNGASPVSSATPAAQPSGSSAQAQAPTAAPTVAQLDAEVPASGEIGTSETERSTLAALAFADVDSGAIGLPGELQRWAPGAEPVSAEVDGKDESRLESPAQRLGLNGKTRAKAVKCLTEAVYFEARGEPLRGQEAVAQVVMNRVFSGYYPNNVCGVVFQNASHYLACQFTFACEHKDLSRIEEPEMWEQAERIANDTLDGKIWLADIGHATHYHAYWVHPSWVHEMTRLYKLGVHTFYRPRAWGNGDYEPVWGTPPDTSQADPKSDAAAKGPQASATPVLGVAKS